MWCTGPWLCCQDSCGQSAYSKDAMYTTWLTKKKWKVVAVCEGMTHGLAWSIPPALQSEHLPGKQFCGWLTRPASS